MAAYPPAQGSLCHERSVSLQECQSGFAPCPTSYSHAHGRLQTVMEAASTVTVAVQAPIDPYRFNMFMSDLLAERGSDIKQMHGILSIQGYGNHGTHFKFEGSQQTVRFGPTVGSATDSTVTFSGHQLSARDLQEALDSCTWLPVAPGWTEHFAPGVHQPFYYHQATGRKQWQRPAAVEAEPAAPLRTQSQSAVLLASQAAVPQLASQAAVPQLSRPLSYTSEVSDTSESFSLRRKQKRSRPHARSAVSCPCDASDACAAVFDIRGKEDERNAKRMRDEDVTSKLADLDVEESATPLFDSASELEAARGGQSKLHSRKISSSAQSRRDQQVKEGLRRSSSCPWNPNQLEYIRQLSALQC